MNKEIKEEMKNCAFWLEFYAKNQLIQTDPNEDQREMTARDELKKNLFKWASIINKLIEDLK